jgi:cystathionine beta-lyase/cystathionine gamma-synthase
MACSWGGYESLVFPAITLYDSQNYGKTTLPINMLRFYVGLEDAEFLIKDLEKALSNV